MVHRLHGDMGDDRMVWSLLKISATEIYWVHYRLSFWRCDSTDISYDFVHEAASFFYVTLADLHV